MSEKFFEDLFSKKKDKSTYLEQLYKVPIKDKGDNRARFLPQDPNISQQMDLLFLPNDNGYKYALVIVDVGSGITDAEPMKDKKSKNILQGVKSIYSRNILKLPKMITVDDGKEFKGDVSKYFKDNNVYVKVSKPYRHRQQAIVESRNKTIGKALFKRMTASEILTGEESKNWIDNLPILIKVLNKKIKEKPKKKIDNKVLCQGDSCKLLKVGSKVRVALDTPISNISGRKEVGNFRTTDIRWNTTIKTITDIYLRPQAPPMYILNNDKKTAYTKNQLQLVKDNEKKPKPELIQGKPNTYIVEKILNKRKYKNKVQYYIKWLGFSIVDGTWENKTDLIKNPEIKKMIDEYEN